MNRNSRRQFMGQIGQGMLVAGLGASLASDLGLAPLLADSTAGRLSFGSLEPLVALMQESEPAKLTALLVDELKSGTELKTLVAAGALANARTFGGQDYVGFHTFMALAPAYRMAQELPSEQRPLPVLKVLFRNANRIQEFGGRGSEVLYPLKEADVVGNANGEQLREVSRNGEMNQAEQVFSRIAQGPLGEAFNHLQFEVQDEVDVHRVVLSWRAWDTLELAGKEWAHTLLRQSVRYCVQTEQRMAERGYARSPIRTVLPKLLDEYQLLSRPLGQKNGDDTWLQGLANTIFRGSREQAADAVSQSLRDGYAPEAIGEAISVAANQLVLHDPGRPEKWSNAEKPAGSCHGDSVGVHASDAANAWRNICRVSNSRNIVASLIVGAFHTGGQSDRSNSQPYPFAEHLSEVRSTNAGQLIGEADEAIRAKDQLRSAAVISKYGALGYDPREVFQLLLKYATSEDGALHAEKYYQTVVTEFAATRPAFRWGQLVALARVTASEFGHPSAGYDEARKLLNV